MTNPNKQELFNDCHKIFKNCLPNLFNLYLVLAGSRTMAILELDAPFHNDYKTENSAFLDFLSRNNTIDDKTKENKNNVNICSLISKLHILVRKYSGEITFVSNSMRAIAVINPKFRNWNKLATAISREETESSIYALADLLHYPQHVKEYMKVNKKIQVVITLKNSQNNDEKKVRLYDIKVSKFEDYSHQCLKYKKCLEDVFYKKIWYVDEIEDLHIDIKK
jgi:hypothetical protein